MKLNEREKLEHKLELLLKMGENKTIQELIEKVKDKLDKLNGLPKDKKDRKDKKDQS